MTRRHLMWRGLLAAGALFVLGPLSGQAQNVEAILRASERLELTEQQVQQLDAIRRETVQRRTAEMARMAELRSQLEAGQIRRSDVMAAMEDQRDARQASADQRRAAIEGILTEAQRESLQEMRRRSARQRGAVSPRGGAVGPRGGAVGPRRGAVGPRGGPGARRGPGVGFAPVRPGFGPGDRPGPLPGPRAGLGGEPLPGDADLGPR